MDHVTSEDEAWEGEKGRRITREAQSSCFLGFPPKGRKEQCRHSWRQASGLCPHPQLLGSGQADMEQKRPRPEKALPDSQVGTNSHLALPLGKYTGIKDGFLISAGSLGPGAKLSMQSPFPSHS